MYSTSKQDNKEDEDIEMNEIPMPASLSESVQWFTWSKLDMVMEVTGRGVLNLLYY